MNVTPYGLAECCICDAPAVVAIRESPESLLMGYCRDDGIAEVAAFPDSQVFALAEVS